MRNRRADWALGAVLAALSYIPLFLSRPGAVAADTKQYLYLDPARLTTGAATVWDPNTGMGTVTHENIGYLFPMGPYYTAVHWLGVPMWVGERIWMGTLMLLAGLGVAYCARRLGLEGPGRAVAAVAYMLSPYILDYMDRISAILMPWAALGWMMGLVATGARTGKWRYPALFALVVALVGGVNATSILLVLVAPAIWLAHAVWVTKEVSLRRALVTSGRLALLCSAVSLWWAAALWAEGKYGFNVLRVTETVPTVSSTSSAAEVLRGLGYWYFYGWDKVQPWTLQSVPYLESPWLIAVSFLVPAAGIVLGMVTRWVYRSLCLALVGVGVVVAVGAFPFTSPSLFGSLIKGASAGSEVALGMRSVDRIVPIVVIGLALLMGSGVTALHLRRPSFGLVAGAVCVGLVAADLPALWTGGLIASNLSRPSQLPSYYSAAMDYLNSQGASSRVLGLPGEDFAAYSFGVTQDPIPEGLLTRPYVSRQVQPAGTPPSVNLLQSLDEPLQEGTLDMAAIGPVARLMSVGQILLQNNLQYERYHLPFPQILYGEMTTQSGLGAPHNFGGPDVAAQIKYPMDTELRLGIPTGTPEPPALSVFNVANPRPLVRAEANSSPIVLAGDGAGIVEAAGAGLLGGDQPILYAADTAKDPAELSQALAAGATLVVTDTNPLASYKWGSLQGNIGQVQQPGVPDLSNTPSVYDPPVFPGETAADQTVAVVSGIKSVQATQYGDSLAYTPEFKPINAFDGNPSTAWSFGAHEAVNGIKLIATLDHPVTAGQVTLTQLRPYGSVKRHITSVTLSFDGHHPVTVRLGPASWSSSGQTVRFPARTFSEFQLVVDGATGGADKRWDGLPSVGFTSIAIPGVGPASETLRMPTDLLSQAGAASLSHPLDILMQRRRVSGPPRQDPQRYISRTFDLPTARTFDLSGAAEINAGDSDYLIDQMVGLTPDGPLPPTQPASTPGPATVVVANSSTRLDEDRQARANAAVDGNPATAWIAETGPQAGEWLRVTLSKPITFDHLDLQVLNDGRHSLPSRITVATASGSETVNVPVPKVGYGRPQNATTTVPISFPALTGSTVKVTIDAVHQVRALDYYATYTGATDILPVGIAELGLPGVVQPPAPARIPAVCTAGLLSVDGKPVDVEITGSSASALAGQELSVHLCGSSAGGIHLGPGPHTVVTSPRLPSGWSIDQLWLSSAAGGGAAPLGSTVLTSAPAQPPVHVVSQNRTSMTLTVTTTGSPFWLVLGQSYSKGWKATIDGGPRLGAPKLVDAYANGWMVPAMPPGRQLTVHLEWAPQKVVWVAIILSVAALLVCVALAAGLPGRVRRRRAARGVEGLPAGVYPSPASWRALAGWPVAGSRAAPGWAVSVSVAVVWGLAAAAVTRPAIGAVAAVTALAATRRPAGRSLCRLGALAALLVLPGYVVAQQIWRRYWPSIQWPADMSSANDIAWLALSLAGSDVVAGWVRSRLGRLRVGSLTDRRPPGEAGLDADRRSRRAVGGGRL